jgi:hypothetical protein
MASLSFFAAREDHEGLLEFIFRDLGCEVFEAYSGYDDEIRKFTTVAEIEEAFELGVDPSGHGSEPYLMLWAPSSGGQPRVKRIPLRVPGASFRESVEGWGLVQLLLGGIHGRRLTSSSFAHNTEARARKWEEASNRLGRVDDWDWGELQKVSNSFGTRSPGGWRSASRRRRRSFPVPTR